MNPFTLGLRPKFFLYSNTLIAVTMGVVTVLTVLNERSTHYDEIVGRGVSLTEAFAVPVTDALMYGEQRLVVEEGLVESYVDGLMARNRDRVRYVIITDVNGRVTHSNLWDLIGRPFERSLDAHAWRNAAGVDQQVTRSGERVIEVRTPLHISTRFWGTLAIGFSLAPVEQEMRGIAKRAGLVAIALMLGNSIMTAIYVETLIRPILNLHETMRQAGRGDLKVRAPVKLWDEVGELSAAFNRMMGELEQRREQERVRRAQLAHTEKMAAVGTLAAGVAHEVNNPLAGILTCLETIRTHPEDSETRDRYLGLVEDGIKRIEHTVVNLLDFSRQNDIRPEPNSLNQNLRHVVELTCYQLRENRVEVSFELGEPDPVVLADHFQMEQLFLNLVLNAIQAMPRGGHLTLRTRSENERAVAEVSDTGPGVSEENRDRIFDPFFTTREVGKGTGLGLAVSYNIVAAHGGVIEVDEAPGGGAVFRVVFPRERPPASEGART